MENESMSDRLLTPVQTLKTTGARALATWRMDEVRWLAAAQLARDVPGESAHMNGGDSDIEAPLFRMEGGRFLQDGALPLAGGEDVEYFEIGGRRFLAAAGIRTGRGPYDLNTQATLYEWRDGAWAPHQRFDVFAAKQWRAFSIGERHFLALAQGVTVEGVNAVHPRTSRIFEWNGECFEAFQAIDGMWGYDWNYACRGDAHFLAYADHVSGSSVLRWDGARFVTFQRFEEKGGRTFRFFEAQGAFWMVHVNLLGATTLYRLDGERFVEVQHLGGAGGRELCLVEGAHGRYLVRVCFITGTPQAPIVESESQVFRWMGSGFALAETFETSGATSALSFMEGDTRYLAVTNSLSADQRFGVASTLYRFDV
ncbi:hypothetical protein LMG27952_01266 [Paraburkholderia hiiakae]|uniref:EPTP domain-containing protein n=1 Tax=Paraburkholderia hiiakae TaxID=1081782 RepID=A0ABN7HKT5_9BURK|nr:hypothetical protein [Paraburkholderia hiiakae]CAD6520194.1 hypothetical protein LMG27952_01266 [Paraburkholderia hiiakae]